MSEGILLVAHEQLRAERRCGQLLKEMKARANVVPVWSGKNSAAGVRKKNSGIPVRTPEPCQLPASAEAKCRAHNPGPVMCIDNYNISSANKLLRCV